jgi:hypothetical protein
MTPERLDLDAIEANLKLEPYLGGALIENDYVRALVAEVRSLRQQVEWWRTQAREVVALRSQRDELAAALSALVARFDEQQLKQMWPSPSCTCESCTAFTERLDAARRVVGAASVEGEDGKP